MADFSPLLTHCAGPVPGLQDLVPSYLSIDTDSRVVRLDSWSKVLAPGLRLGWVTAHPDVVDLMALALHASLNGPPGISQVQCLYVLFNMHQTITYLVTLHMDKPYQDRDIMLVKIKLQQLHMGILKICHMLAVINQSGHQLVLPMLSPQFERCALTCNWACLCPRTYEQNKW